jgi:hypothetical protein
VRSCVGETPRGCGFSRKGPADGALAPFADIDPRDTTLD